jgi:hypothetical protein
MWPDPSFSDLDPSFRITDPDPKEIFTDQDTGSGTGTHIKNVNLPDRSDSEGWFDADKNDKGTPTCGLSYQRL